jgi:spermidine synthase
MTSINQDTENPTRRAHTGLVQAGGRRLYAKVARPRHGSSPFAALVRAALIMMVLGHALNAAEKIVFEVTSPYHHIRVVDNQGLRTLMFDNSTESRISLANPIQGHFEYSDYFHMPWLWNEKINRVLMIGLGGGTTAMSWQHYYSNVVFETVELDPKVVQVAKSHFFVKESPSLRIQVEDGRIFLRRSQAVYDLLILDAYTVSRYGSSIPYSLVTQEFFTLADKHLTTNGMLAYNVIGTLQGDQETVVSAVYKTLRSVFPRVYYFPASGSQNVVLLATKDATLRTLPELHGQYAALTNQGWQTLPVFSARLKNFRNDPPPAVERSRLLTDDYAPTDGMLSLRQPFSR